MNDPINEALKLQQTASKYGFDWKNIESVFEKLQEEIEEIKQEIERSDKLKIEDEFGDLLFQCLNLSRHLKIDPKEALIRASKKFQRRFTHVLHLAQKENLSLDLLTEERLIDLWNEAKKSTC